MVRFFGLVALILAGLLKNGRIYECVQLVLLVLVLEYEYWSMYYFLLSLYK
jgi:hypothetical protein